MRLLIVLITYNRLAYTKKTLRHLWQTIELPYHLIIVDNASTDGTVKYLRGHESRERVDKVIFNPDNYYPGKATNIGWAEGLKLFDDVTHLMRLDNDMELLKGWDYAAESYFKAIPELGQLGLDHEAIEDSRAKLREREINGKTINPYPGNIGGPCIIRKSLWDLGLRYDEVRWDDGRNTPLQEDSKLSKKVSDLGYLFGHMTEDLARTFANKDNWSDYPEYYTKTMTERGYLERGGVLGL